MGKIPDQYVSPMTPYSIHLWTSQKNNLSSGQMTFEIAIPSYQRSKKLRDKTLSWLQDERITPDRITVFVASEDEKKEYEKVLLSNSYGRLVVGVPGLNQQLNFIRQYYPDGTRVLRIDDDIKNVKMLTRRSFQCIADQMFDLCDQEGATLWSIYPVNNLFFCKERVLVGKVYCCGCLNGFLNDKTIVFPEKVLEDKWLSLTCWLTNGKTLRYEGACPDTTYFASGGLAEYRKTNSTSIDAQNCYDLFPEHCVLRQMKKGFTDVNWRTVRQGIRFLL